MLFKKINPSHIKGKNMAIGFTKKDAKPKNKDPRNACSADFLFLYMPYVIKSENK
jgi:hypothetical protein